MIYQLAAFVKKQFGVDTYAIVEEFPMLHAGWECDESVVVIAVQGKKYAIGSMHGSPCILDKAALLDKASEYKNVLQRTLNAAESVD